MRDLREVIQVIFTHAGIVGSVDVTWETEQVCGIKVTWMPWNRIGMEDITADLIEAGTIVDDSCLYLRVKKTETVAAATLTVNLASEEWRRELARQMGQILGQELREAVIENDR